MESNVAQLPLSHRAWAWFEKNHKQALVGAVAVVIIGVVVAFFIWRQGQRQKEAGAALSDVSLTASASTPAGATIAPEAYLKVAAQYPNSKAGAQAVLLAGGSLFAEGKYPEAQAQFERFTREYHNSSLLGEALLGIASCLEAQGKLDQAVTAYKELIARHPGESIVPQAQFSLAGLYERQKRPELARDMYEQVDRESRYSILGSEAGLRLQELSEKNPNLPPSLGAPATSPTVKAPPTNALEQNLKEKIVGSNAPAPAAKK